MQAGMVANAWDYPWSSARFHTGRAESDPLVKDWALSALITDSEEFLTGGMAGEIERLRMATQTGRPAGNDVFITKVEHMTGRDLSKGTSGRPKKH